MNGDATVQDGTIDLCSVESRAREKAIEGLAALLPQMETRLYPVDYNVFKGCMDYLTYANHTRDYNKHLKGGLLMTTCLAKITGLTATQEKYLKDTEAISLMWQGRGVLIDYIACRIAQANFRKAIGSLYFPPKPGE